MTLKLTIRASIIAVVTMLTLVFTTAINPSPAEATTTSQLQTKVDVLNSVGNLAERPGNKSVAGLLRSYRIPLG